MIDVRALAKSYRVHQRDPGLGAAFRSLLHREYSEVRAVGPAELLNGGVQLLYLTREP